MAYWLIKSNPRCFNIEDLQGAGTEMWDGVRNYRARNFMRDDMKVDDKAFFITLAPNLLASLVS